MDLCCLLVHEPRSHLTRPHKPRPGSCGGPIYPQTHGGGGGGSSKISERVCFRQEFLPGTYSSKGSIHRLPS